MVMKFLSIYKSVEKGVPPSQEEMCKMGELIEEGMRAGYLLKVEGCLPSALGARVRLSSGSVKVTDGPFSESKEWIAGFDVLDCADLDEAIEIAAKHPMAYRGRLELRPIWPLDEG
jgi:hypothetical protein